MADRLNDQIIIAGATGSGTRFVQFWGDTKIAGSAAEMCMAEMNLGGGVAARMLMIAMQCPQEWVPVVLDTFERFRAGQDIEATHSVLWQFGRPVFTELEAVTS